MNINKINENTALVEEKDLIENKKNYTNRVAPIDIWWDLIHSEKDLFEIKQELGLVYESNLPELGAIIISSTCQYNCKHCIYHPDYSKFNACLSFDQWKGIIRNIFEDLEIKTFIHNGRSMDDTGIKVLQWMRQEFSDVRIGLIDNGISLIPYLDELYDIQPDWIDISIDGMDKEHGLQRNRVGSFNETFKTISFLLQKDIAPKINILSCLTTINKDSIMYFMKHNYDNDN